MHRLVTSVHGVPATTEMFEWLANNRDIVASVEHAPLEVFEAWADFENMYLDGIEGPWVVILDGPDEDVVYFKLRWC